MAQADGWDDSCDWPRRLLHVETMVSYLWQPGNKYGDHIEPPYNALSYTWGRWELKDGENPDVNALHIKDIPWKVPRIDPAHFTADKLLSTIRVATIQNTSSNVTPVNFVWLDIACIDQAQDLEENTSEVGRQAKISKKSANVFAWLTSFKSDSSFKTWFEQSVLTFKSWLCHANWGA